MNKWEPAKTAPLDRQFLARVERYFVDETDGSVWEGVIGPIFWEDALEAFTDCIGTPVNKRIKGGVQKMTHWMEMPVSLSTEGAFSD